MEIIKINKEQKIKLLNEDNRALICILNEIQYNKLTRYLKSINELYYKTLYQCAVVYNIYSSDIHLNTIQIRDKYKISKVFEIIKYLTESGLMTKTYNGNSFSKKISKFDFVAKNTMNYYLFFNEVDTINNNINILSNNNVDITNNKIEIDTLNNIKVNISIALDILGETFDTNKNTEEYYTELNKVIRIYNNDKYIDVKDKSNIRHSINNIRNTKLYTSLYTTIEDKDVYLSELSLSNSLFTMLLKFLIDNNIDIDDTFIDVVKNGNLYKYISTQSNNILIDTNIGIVSNTNNYKELNLSKIKDVKSASFKYLLFAKKITNNKYTKLFNELFPKTYKYIKLLVNNNISLYNIILSDIQNNTFKINKLKNWKLNINDGILFPNIYKDKEIYNKEMRNIENFGKFNYIINNENNIFLINKELTLLDIKEKERKQHKPHKQHKKHKKHKSSAKSINRKQEIIKLKNRGYKNKEIAEILNISLSTVKRAK